MQATPLLALLALTSTLALAQTPAELNSTASDRSGLAITVYNDNLALVKEQRKLSLPAGTVRLALREVSAQMQAETALLTAVTGPPLGLLEQNFDYDLLTPQTLLDKYLGREVVVIRSNPATGVETREKATVIGNQDGTVLRFADRIETGVPGRLAFDSVPATLRDRPTLSVLLQAQGGPQTVELSYLTGGLSWQADYVATLSADNRFLDLSAWVTLNNRSGAAYDNARLQLVAGSVHRVRPEQGLVRMSAMVAKAPMAAPPQEEALGDVHLYTFERLTTLGQNQTKQLALLSAQHVPVTQDYVLQAPGPGYLDRQGSPLNGMKPAVFLNFSNQGGQLGKPLPAGIVRVYAQDSQGGAQFVGEDRIQHTAANEALRLRLGEAFDITADRVQTSYRRLSERQSESAYQLTIRNAKAVPVTVQVKESLSGDWQITQQSLPHRKENAQLAVWSVTVPAQGKTQFSYTAKVTW
jgi:hypothetical protein